MFNIIINRSNKFITTQHLIFIYLKLIQTLSYIKMIMHINSGQMNLYKKDDATLQCIINMSKVF